MRARCQSSSTSPVDSSSVRISPVRSPSTWSSTGTSTLLALSLSTVLRAMRAHPLVLQHDRAERLTDLLLAQNAPFLEWAR